LYILLYWKTGYLDLFNLSQSTMNSTNFLATLNEMADKPAEKFTVKRSPKIEIIENEEKKKTFGKETSVSLAIMKWIATIIMFLLTLGSLVASKVTVISIGQNMRPANFSAEDTKCQGNNCTADIAFTMMVYILLIPNIISFCRTFFNSAFSSSEFWPSLKSVLFVSKSYFSYCILYLIYNIMFFTYIYLFKNMI